MAGINMEKPITLKRDCDAVMVPSGEKINLSAGSAVWLTQNLGGSYTVMTDGHDGDALGMGPVTDAQAAKPAVAGSTEEIEKLVWNQLRLCFDPEIPVNIVDLGLIYDCSVNPLRDGGY